MIKNNDKNQELLMRDAQYRKGLSIAFFNATNAAIEMMKATSNVTLENFHTWRDLLLDEYNAYYARVIASVGEHYDSAVSIKRLRATKTHAELHAVWMSFSQDERQNKEIAKVAFELREKYLVPVIEKKPKKTK